MIEFEVSQHGAELQSLRRAGREYLWQGDPAYWGRRAPILFPSVGRPFEDTVRFGGKAFTMKQHGFARDAEFVPSERGLRMTGEHPNYPYQFDLYANYVAQGDSLHCRWSVVSRQEAPMFFQIGAHPAFLLPDYKADDPVHGYFLLLDAAGKEVRPMVTTQVVHGVGSRAFLPEPKRIESRIPITADTFLNDAILIENGQVASVALLDKSGARVLTVHCPQAQAYGLWAPVKPGCPFVCIEPWCGIADRDGFKGDFSEKDFVHRLGAGEEYLFEYVIEL